MSEYQYYEFQAVDRPLTRDEQAELRRVSTRAAITATRFVNEYHWGDFKGDPVEWMERYFDGFLYFANWGTHELMLRVPRRRLGLETARRYCATNTAAARAIGEHVLLSLTSEDESDGAWAEDEDAGVLGAILPVRGEIASGDHRALHLA